MPIIPSSRLVALIPALNEERAVGDVARGAKEQLPGADVVVIDDGSTDGTAAAARAAGATVLQLPCNLGIGGAVQAGLLYALEQGADGVVRLDGDGQHPPDQIPRLLRTLEETGADFVVGSRFAGQTDYRPPLARQVGIGLFARVVSLLCRQRLTDATSGFFAANRAAAAHLAETYAADFPEVESLVTLRRAGYRIAETPVRMDPREHGRSSIGAVQGFYYVLKVLLAVIAASLAAPVAPRVESQDRPQRRRDATNDNGRAP